MSRTSHSRKKGANKMSAYNIETNVYTTPNLKIKTLKSSTRSKLLQPSSSTKLKKILKRLKKPVYISILDRSVVLLPDGVESLYSSLFFASCREEVIPLEARYQVKVLVGHVARPYFFRREPTTGANEIQLEAEATAADQYHKTRWNNFVYTLLPKAAFMSGSRDKSYGNNLQAPGWWVSCLGLSWMTIYYSMLPISLQTSHLGSYLAAANVQSLRVLVPRGAVVIVEYFMGSDAVKSIDRSSK
ncbi:hypothetical protein GGR58DRAFT_320321 [Xylaria digitata]|nr:hypothetical protein GGR58DRAFT_320321 [Xylaria digitata]